MYDLEKLGNNIKCLRVAYNESQEKLGEVIHVSKSAVSMYETGKREPSKETLKAIAEHFWVSIEELLSEDFSAIGNKKVDINPYALWEEIDVIFPIASSSKAIENEHFKKANAIHHAMFDSLRLMAMRNKTTSDTEDDIDVCFEEYLEALEYENSKEEAAANIVGLWLWFLNIFRNGQRLIEKRPAILRHLTSKDRKLKKELEKEDIPFFDQETKEAVDFFLSSKVRKLVIKCLDMIKHSKDWTELADYYLALQYCLALADNELGQELNWRIGAEMMQAFAMLKNPYAIHYRAFSVRAFGWGE